MGWLDEPSYAHLPGARRHIIDEVGRGFWYGTSGGSVYYFIKGLRNSPNGDRLAGGARAVRAHVPRVAGSWGAFWGVWEVLENAIFFARRKEDPWNGIAAGAAASGLVEIRRGARVAARFALFSFAVIGLAEGFVIWCDKNVGGHPAPTVELPPRPQQHVAAWPALAVDRRPRPLGSTPPAAGHVTKPRGFSGIPPRAPIVKEVPAADLGY